MIPMAGGLPKLAVQNHRRLDFLITVAAMHLAPIIDQLIADNHAVRMEERKTRPLLVEAEQVKLFAQLAVVALRGLLQHGQIRGQVFLFLEGRAVNALQHLVVLVAAPVSARYALELHRLDLAGGNDVRPRAKIHEIPLLIQGNQSVFRQIVDQLDLIALPFFLEQLQSVGAADLLAHHRQILLDDALHLLLDIA